MKIESVKVNFAVADRISRKNLLEMMSEMILIPESNELGIYGIEIEGGDKGGGAVEGFKRCEMKFRMFTDAVRKGKKIAVNIDRVRFIQVADAEAGTTEIWMDGHSGDAIVLEVGEDFDTVLSRLNTIAE